MTKQKGLISVEAYTKTTGAKFDRSGMFSPFLSRSRTCRSCGMLQLKTADVVRL